MPRLVVVVLLIGLAVGCAAPRRDRAEQPASTTMSTPDPRATQDCEGSGVAQRRTVRYSVDTGASADLTTLEVVTPQVPAGCGPTPVMVWVHGGGWRTGDRRNHLEDKIDLFTSMGWAFVSVNYRLTPEVQYPVHNDDVATAIGWVLDHAADFDLDGDRLSVMGHSAGAGIAAAVATDPAHLATVGRSPADLRCAVLLDTEGYDVEAMADRGVKIYRDAFGEDPDVWRAASPIRHVDDDAGIPSSLVVTRGTAARRSSATEFVDALRQAGVDAELVDARPLSHAEVNDAVGSVDDDLVTPAIVEFLHSC